MNFRQMSAKRHITSLEVVGKRRETPGRDSMRITYKTRGSRPNSSTPAVVRCVVGVGGAVWVETQSDSLFTNGRPRCLPHGCRLRNAPSQFCDKLLTNCHVKVAQSRYGLLPTTMLTSLATAVY